MSFIQILQNNIVHAIVIKKHVTNHRLHHLQHKCNHLITPIASMLHVFYHLYVKRKILKAQALLNILIKSNEKGNFEMKFQCSKA